MVLSVLETSPDMPTAQDIAARLKRTEGPKAPGLTTVYRSLDLLARMGSIQTILLPDGERRYEMVAPGEHHHHVVCEKCGASVRLASCLVENISSAVRLEFGFELTAHIIELFGLCSDCRAAQARVEPAEPASAVGGSSPDGESRPSRSTAYRCSHVHAGQ